jgi:glycosyltransferase involved in cell wall biosynthesis
VENGIDHLQYSRSCPVAEAKARYGTAPSRTVVGAVGRLSAEKGFDLLLRATAELTRRGHDLEVWIIGAGDELRPLQSLAAELGLGDRVRLWGFRSDTKDLYEAMDIYALSSLREGLPNVLLEAMAMEVPVVATRIAGVPRLIQDGENGILANPGSHLELSEVMERLIHYSQLRHQLAVAGRDTIIRRYSFAARMERVRELYDRLLGTHARAKSTEV